MKLAALVLSAWLSLAASAHAAAWQRPVRGPVLRPFALSVDRYARGQHRGVDLAAPPRTPVRSACSGRVRFAGRVPAGGRTVSVVCGPLAATYQHLGAVAVRRGEAVVAGATIATVGRPGPAPAPAAHLHLGAREVATGRYLDPLALIAGAPRAAPLGRAPRGPTPGGRVPRAPAAPGRAPQPAPVVSRRAPLAVVDPARRGFDPGADPAARVPLAVWLGLVAFGLGLPLGGLARVRRRRRGAAGARARRWAAAHR